MACKGGKCGLKKSGGGSSGNTGPKVSLMTPQQSALMEALSKLGMQSAQEMYPRIMGDPYAGFAPIETRAREQFQQHTVPTLAERFTNMRNPSDNAGFMSLIGSAGAGLDTDLAAQRALYGQQMLGQQQHFLSTLLGQAGRPQFEPIYKQRGPNAWSTIGGALMGAAPMFMGGR